MTKNNLPECEKLDEIADKLSLISEFVEYCEYRATQGVYRPKDLVYEFFGVDIEKVKQGRKDLFKLIKERKV